jgi:hypothetical protein
MQADYWREGKEDSALEYLASIDQDFSSRTTARRLPAPTHAATPWQHRRGALPPCGPPGFSAFFPGAGRGRKTDFRWSAEHIAAIIPGLGLDEGAAPGRRNRPAPAGFGAQIASLRCPTLLSSTTILRRLVENARPKRSQAARILVERTPVE